MLPSKTQQRRRKTIAVCPFSFSQCPKQIKPLKSEVSAGKLFQTSVTERALLETVSFRQTPLFCWRSEQTRRLGLSTAADYGSSSDPGGNLIREGGCIRLMTVRQCQRLLRHVACPVSEAPLKTDHDYLTPASLRVTRTSVDESMRCCLPREQLLWLTHTVSMASICVCIIL